MKSIENQEEKNSEKLTRLLSVLNELGFDKDKDFATAIGKSKAYVSQIKSTGVIPKTLGQLLEDKLGISRAWFESGVGEKFLKGLVHKNEPQKSIEHELERLRRDNSALHERLGELKYTIDLQKRHIALLEEKCAPNRAVSQ